MEKRQNHQERGKMKDNLLIHPVVRENRRKLLAKIRINEDKRPK